MNSSDGLRALREKLKTGGVSTGSWCQLPSPDIAEILAFQEFEWITFDMEHGLISYQDLPNMCRAVEARSKISLARLGDCGRMEILRALDAGCSGIICPMIESKQNLLDIIDMASWPPTGKRGVAFNRNNLFGLRFDQEKYVSENPFIVAMIETRKGVDNLSEILSVDKLDAILVGPYDLSASYGVTAQFDSPEFLEALSSMEMLCKKHGVPFGIHQVEPSVDLLQKNIANGYRFIAYSMDTVFLTTNSNFLLDDSV
ncbi:aldolase/citrate lyase family protein [Gammaproteobacteria bacterium]|nr:aldolase/citrate lyase family protein [Gammaproteobacteria bacterium]